MCEQSALTHTSGSVPTPRAWSPGRGRPPRRSARRANTKHRAIRQPNPIDPDTTCRVAGQVKWFEVPLGAPGGNPFAESARKMPAAMSATPNPTRSLGAHVPPSPERPRTRRTPTAPAIVMAPVTTSAPWVRFIESRHVPNRLKSPAQRGCEFRTAKSSGTRCYAMGPNCWPFFCYFRSLQAGESEGFDHCFTP